MVFDGTAWSATGRNQTADGHQTWTAVAARGWRHLCHVGHCSLHVVLWSLLQRQSTAHSLAKPSSHPHSSMHTCLALKHVVITSYLCPWHTCRKLARVIRRWKLTNVTCFPALVFSSCGNLARYSAMLYSTLESGINGALWLVSFVDLLVCKHMLQTSLLL